MRKLTKGTGKRVVAASLSAMMIFSTAFANTSTVTYAAAPSVDADAADGTLSIGNDYISRSFSVTDGKVVTSEVLNKRISKNLVPGAGSEDFVINTIAPAVVEGEAEALAADTVDARVSVEREEKIAVTAANASLTAGDNTTAAAAEVAKLFDGNNCLNVANGNIAEHIGMGGGNPFVLEVDFGAEKELSKMTVYKRQGYTAAGWGLNGTMGGYEIWVKDAEAADWTQVKTGEFTEEDYNLHEGTDQAGNTLYNVGDPVSAVLDTPVTAQYVKVVQTSSIPANVQEFTSAEIEFFEKIVEEQELTGLDRTGWTATLKNNAGTEIATPANVKTILFDGNTGTNIDNYQVAGNPITLEINLGSVQKVNALSVDKRPGYANGYGLNGTMGKFELYVSADGKNWEAAGAGQFTSEAYNLRSENGLDNVGDRVYANFHKAYDTQYVRIVQTEGIPANIQEFTTSEVNLYSEKIGGTTWEDKDWTPAPEVPDTLIASSALTFAGAEATTVDGDNALRISYEPYALNGVTWNIAQVFTLNSEDHYMRSFLEISVDDQEKAQIDYIDTDSFVLPADAITWCRPADSAVSSQWIGKHELMLGQPIYVNGMFLGNEFPANDNIIADNTTQIRYYSGKNFTKMAADKQLTDGKLVTWNNVIGSALGTDTSVVQIDFFDYIEDIATQTKFRKQYNSWYDNMMNITDESIASSFNGAEEGLTQNGVEPLDSYVVDDGWNNYYDGTYTQAGSSQGSGTPNQTGFWEFNNKFPNELYTSTELVDKFQSSFGVWVGPQGGYNFFGSFADFLASKGTGEVQNDFWKNICTGSRLYLKNFEDRFTDYQTRFNIDYWKWDGFAVRPCTNASHHHMTGGTQNMYYTSDMWEAWTDLFENVRAARAAEGKGLFINATCYVNLSPWLLQWVNTIWVQDSGDTGELGTGERHQQKIYYRDQVYYQLYKQNELQFPLKNIYNHDPIYGVSDRSNATTEVFREFLFANAVRGTAFWELYYSPSIMDDAKWKVTADALAWAEENHDVLKNAKLHGNQPRNGVYGYSCWNGTEGVVSFTNPLDTEQTYSLTIDNTVGAVPELANAAGVQVHPYAAEPVAAISYGDTIEVTLPAHTTIIYQYGHADTTAPTVVSAKVTGENEVTVKFSERVELGTLTVDGAAAEAELMDDYRTVVLTTAAAITEDAAVGVNLKDVYDNTLDAEVQAAYYENGVIAEAANAADLKDAAGVTMSYDAVSDTTWFDNLNTERELNTTNTIEGIEDFTIHTGVQTTQTGVTLFSSDDVTLSINADGFVEFRVKDLVLTSENQVTTVNEKAHGTFNTAEYVPTTTTTVTAGKVNDGEAYSIDAVREPNGMLKIYVDGKLASSLYDKNHVNEALAGGQLSIGSEGFTGKLAGVEVLNRAVGYSETEEIADVPDSILTPSHEGWTASACTEMSGMSGDASAAAAIDGNLNSWWHTNYTGSDSCAAGTHWIQIDFNKEESFDKFMYTGRGAASNGSIKDYKLEILGEDGTVIATEEGTFTNDAGEQTVDLGQVYNAYGVKLTAKTTQNGQNFAAAKEINIGKADTLMDEAALAAAKEALLDTVKDLDLSGYTEESVAVYEAVLDKVTNVERASEATWNQLKKELEDAVEGLTEKVELDTAALTAAIAAAKALTEIDYTVEDWDALQAAITTAEGVLANATIQQQLDDAKAALDAVVAGLTKLDRTALNAAIAAAEAYTKDAYTDESWNALQTALNAARAALGSRVQSEITAAADALTAAINGLEEKEEPPVELDKDALTAAIKAADAVKSEGYTKDSWNKFQNALAAAKAALKSAETQAELDKAAADLNAAKAALVKEEAKPTPPENNNNNNNDNNDNNDNGNSGSSSGGSNTTQTGGAKTADTSAIGFYMSVLLMAACGLAVLYRRKREF